MKKIMKRAWEIYRTLEGDRLAKLSMALRQAWAEAKTEKSNSFKALEVAEWFLSKKAKELGRRTFVGDVPAIIGETEKAYKVIVNAIRNTTTMWVPKSLCTWVKVSKFYHQTRTFENWEDGMNWVSEIRGAFC